MAQLLRAAAPQADLYADAGYVGKKQSRFIMAKNMHPFVCRKRFKNKSLTAFDRLYNHFVASIRCRIEHVLGFMERSLGGSKVRCSGQIRVAAQIALMSLLYNVFRLRFFVYKQT